MRMRAKIALAVIAATGTILFLPGLASAHAQRQVGPYHLEIGFGTEPTYVGQPNSVQLLLTKHGRPFLHLGDSLKVDVSFGTDSTELPLVPNFEPGGDGIQGDYRAWFVPTQAGAYTFHFVGSLNRTKFNVSVTGGPTTFATVEDMSSITFPKVALPANNELATRIQQDATRTQGSVAAATTAARDAHGAASTARTIAIVGILVGAVGIVVGGIALSAARKKTVAA